MMTPEELQAKVAEVSVREAWEWEDLIVGIAQGLTASKLIKSGDGSIGTGSGKGEQYKVLPVDDYRERLVRIAGLAVAAIAEYDSKMLAADAVRAAALVPAPRPEGT